MATFRDILLQVTGDSADADKTLASVSAKLDALAAKSVKIHVSVDGLAEAEAELAALGQRTIKIPVRLDRSTLRNEISKAAQEAESVIHRGAVGAVPSFRGPISKVASAAGAGAAGAEAAASALGDAADNTEHLVTTIDRGRNGIVGFGFNLAGLTHAILGVGIAILVTTAPAIAALAASLAGAAAAAGGLAVAFGGILGPAILTLIGPLQGLAKVFAAVQAARQGQSLAQTAQGHQQAANAALAHQRAEEGLVRAVRDARRGIRDATHDDATAERSLEDATRNLAQTTVDAYDRMKESIFGVRDALFALQHAKNDAERAKLDQQEAVLQLQRLRKELGLTGAEFDALFNQITDVRLSPQALRALLPQVDALGLSQENLIRVKNAILDVSDANIRQKESVNQIGESTLRYNQAQRNRNRFAREGILAYEPLRSATAGLADAQWAASRAQEHLNDVLLDGVNHAPSVESARDALRSATQGLAAESQKARTALQQVPKAFRPIVNAIAGKGGLIDAFNAVTKPVNKLFGQAFLLGVQGAQKILREFTGDIRTLGGTMAQATTRFFSGLGGNRSKTFFHDMFAAAGPAIDSLEGSLEHLFGFLSNVAEAAIHPLQRALDGVSDTLGNWDKKTKKGTDGFKTMSRIFDEGVTALGKWLTLLGAVGQLVLDFFDVTSKDSNGMLDSLTKTVNKWDEWVKDPANAGKIHEAIQTAVDVLGDLFDILGDIVELFVAATPIARDLFSAIVSLLRPWLGIIRNILDVTKKLPGPLRTIGGLLAGFVAIGGPLVAWKLAIGAVKGAFASLAGSIVGRFAAGSRVRRALETLFDSAIPSWRKAGREGGADAAVATEESARQTTTRRRGAWRRIGRIAGGSIAGGIVGAAITGSFSGGASGALIGALSAAATEAVAAGLFTPIGLAIGAAIAVGILAYFHRNDIIRQVKEALGLKPTKVNEFTGKFADIKPQLDADSTALHTHLSPAARDVVRKNLLDDINALEKALKAVDKKATVGPDFERLRARLRRALGRRWGGVLPGYGGGDTVPTLLEPGEGVLRKEAVAKLGSGFINALNASYPTVAAAGYANGGIIAASGRAGELHQHFHIPAAAPAEPQPDARTTAALLSQYMRAQGMRLQ